MNAFGHLPKTEGVGSAGGVVRRKGKAGGREKNRKRQRVWVIKVATALIVMAVVLSAWEGELILIGMWKQSVFWICFMSKKTWNKFSGFCWEVKVELLPREFYTVLIQNKYCVLCLSLQRTLYISAREYFYLLFIIFFLCCCPKGGKTPTAYIVLSVFMLHKTNFEYVYFS